MSEKTELESEQERQKDRSSRLCREAIYKLYSIEDQINVSNLQGYTEADREKMWSVIAACREKHATIKAEILAAKSPEIVQSVNLDFDATAQAVSEEKP